MNISNKPYRITQFVVTNERAIREASCESVPAVMVITGPNGCGKSTLLNKLRGVGEGSGKTLYVGPHRTSRRQTVRMRFLSQNPISMSDLLSSNNIPGFEGIDIPSRDRDAWNFDESQSFLKYSLCQIELERQRALTARFDSTGQLSKKEMPDVWQPLRDMTHNLLPHLQFHNIDVTNRDQIKCLWSVHSRNVLVDIDDLSSGEKAVIQLFFPLIEHQIQERLSDIRGSESLKDRGALAILMDEPELHLHPYLQGKVLDYVRSLSLLEGVQFIMATHSPSLVEMTTSDELYLLRPEELIGSDENQLIKIADDEDRLKMIRDVFGSTSGITAMRKIVVVEGSPSTSSSRRAVDMRVYRFLNSRFDQINMIAAGGKNEAKSLVKKLNELLVHISPPLTATALLDRDVEEGESNDPQILLLPVSMVENFLVDPMVVWNAINVIRHKTEFQNEKEVENALENIVNECESDEVSRRVKAVFSSRTFRLKGDISKVKNEISEFHKELLEAFSDERLETVVSAAKNAVKALKETESRREFFDGKRILNDFYSKHLHSSGMSKEIFIYECARHASQRRSVEAFIKDLFEKVGVADSEAQS